MWGLFVSENYRIISHKLKHKDLRNCFLFKHFIINNKTLRSQLIKSLLLCFFLRRIKCQNFSTFPKNILNNKIFIFSIIFSIFLKLNWKRIDNLYINLMNFLFSFESFSYFFHLKNRKNYRLCRTPCAKHCNADKMCNNS